MTSTSYTRIKSIAQTHGNEMCPYVYELNGETGVRRCLLGWMAIDSGVRLPDERYNTHALGMKGTARFLKEMQSEYALSLDQLKGLQRANDESKNAAHLTELVSGLLETWSAALVTLVNNDPYRPIDKYPYAATHRPAHIAPTV